MDAQLRGRERVSRGPGGAQRSAATAQGRRFPREETPRAGGTACRGSSRRCAQGWWAGLGRRGRRWGRGSVEGRVEAGKRGHPVGVQAGPGWRRRLSGWAPVLHLPTPLQAQGRPVDLRNPMPGGDAPAPFPLLSYGTPGCHSKSPGFVPSVWATALHGAVWPGTRPTPGAPDSAIHVGNDPRPRECPTDGTRATAGECTGLRSGRPGRLKGRSRSSHPQGPVSTQGRVRDRAPNKALERRQTATSRGKAGQRAGPQCADRMGRQ